jgi:hypothetical protein
MDASPGGASCTDDLALGVRSAPICDRAPAIADAQAHEWPDCLDRVHPLVGPPEAVGGPIVGFEQYSTDAQSRRDRDTIDWLGHVNDPVDPRRERLEFLTSSEAGTDDREFISAEPRNGIGLSRGRAQAVSDLA